MDKELSNQSILSGVMRDTRGKGSGKRVFGGIGFSIYLLIGAGIAVFSVWTGNDIGTNAAIIFNGIGITSGSLLGIGVVEGFAEAKKLKTQIDNMSTEASNGH